MPEIKFIEDSGIEHIVSVKAGTTVMEAARDNDIPGISAECGGACSCATCHVYVQADWFKLAGDPDGMETDMLECAEDVKPISRLGCQIVLTDLLDGAIFGIPPK